ncbi:MAG: hypothetical protein ABIO04_06305 [Ferruginibacter sp.]
MTSATLDQTISTSYKKNISGANLISTSIAWCTAQEDSRLLWVGLGLTIHGCIITPLTVLTILITGSGLGLLGIAIAIVAMTAVLVVNLAALPTKITIPVFALSLVADIALIIAAII